MKRRPCLLLVLLLLSALKIDGQEPRPAAAIQHRLMPAPMSISFQRGRMRVEPTFTVATQGHSDARLLAGIERAVRRLERRTGMEFARGQAPVPGAASLVIQCQGPGQPIPSLGEDESYRLEVSERQAFVNAQTVVGALRGLETFLQLLTGDAGGYFIPEVRVQGPFRERGRSGFRRVRPFK